VIADVLHEHNRIVGVATHTNDVAWLELGHGSISFLLSNTSACRLDERGSRAEVDGISEGAQLSHSLGYPMSQQTNSGFNAPRFSVGSDDPFEFCIAAASFRLLRRPFSLIGPL
jgi:hypothetical protein